MKRELVSVIITTYRRRLKYVQEAVQSVVKQTYEPIEIILVDDNGENSEYENDLRELCKEFKVKYLHQKSNSGAQISRNNGVLASSGNYIAFLDDDDIWKRTKLEAQMPLFISDDIGMVFCDGYSFFDENKTELYPVREASIFDRPISHEMELFNDWIGSTSQVIIRRSVFDSIGLFDPDMPARQDYEMWLRISKKYKIVGCPEKLFYYRLHSGTRISTDWKKCYDSYDLILKKYKTDYDNNRYYKGKLVLKRFRTALNAGKVLRAVGNLIYAFGCSPKCVIDVLKRNIGGVDFVEYYKNLWDDIPDVTRNELRKAK